MIALALLLGSCSTSAGGEATTGTILIGDEVVQGFSAVELRSDLALASPLALTASEAATYSWLYERAADIHISACMRAAGFQFFPLAADAEGTLQPVLGESVVDKAGYEFVNQVFQLEADRQAQPETIGDPNEAYVATLTASEAEAYELALFGASGATLEALAENREVQESGLVTSSPVDGCLFEGRAAVDTDQSWNSVHDFANRARLDRRRVRDLAATHPDLVSVREGWRRCMAERGFEAQDRSEVVSQVVTERLETKTLEGAIPRVDTPEFAELLAPTEFELSIATADIACSEIHPQREVEELSILNAEAYLRENVQGFANLGLDWQQLRPQIEQAVSKVLGEVVVDKVVSGNG